MSGTMICLGSSWNQTSDRMILIQVYPGWETYKIVLS